MTLIRKVYHKIFKKKISDANSFENYVFDLNTKYDLQTFYIIKKILSIDSNTIDIGAHRGDILKKMIESSPEGQHFAFEPLPHLYNFLLDKFKRNTKVFPFALSDFTGKTTFNYVTTNPGYSGILKRKYDRPEEDKIIDVEVRKLDDIISLDTPIKFIKIDVEGAEFGVLKGSVNLISKWKPIIIYEQGLGSADIYGTKPGEFFDFMDSLGFKISLMEYYLLDKDPLTREEYCHNFNKGYNYYFIAY